MDDGAAAPSSGRDTLADPQRLLDEIAAEMDALPREGEVADYIPELAKVPPDRFGMCLRQVDGSLARTGDTERRFSIQSISKVLALTLALECDPEDLWRRVGVEPSGDPFNSLVQLEHENGVPRNPLINAGAMVVVDVLLSNVDAPFDRLLALVRQLAGAPDIGVNDAVADSEAATGERNRALAHLMKAFGNIHNEVDRVLEFYFRMCSIEMSCTELATTFSYLVDHGRSSRGPAPDLTARQTKRINALMLTCGFYDEAGEFAFVVGLPGKSGVGGGIVAVHPGHYSVAVWSPRLNPKGNSRLGMAALERLAVRTGASIF